jgi:hypothetical protein
MAIRVFDELTAAERGKAFVSASDAILGKAKALGSAEAILGKVRTPTFLALEAWRTKDILGIDKAREAAAEMARQFAKIGIPSSTARDSFMSQITSALDGVKFASPTREWLAQLAQQTEAQRKGWASLHDYGISEALRSLCAPSAVHRQFVADLISSAQATREQTASLKVTGPAIGALGWVGGWLEQGARHKELSVHGVSEMFARDSLGLLAAYRSVRELLPIEPNWAPSRDLAFQLRTADIAAGREESESFKPVREEALATTEDTLPLALEHLDPRLKVEFIRARSVYRSDLASPRAFLVSTRVLLENVARRATPEMKPRAPFAARLARVFHGRNEWPFLQADLRGGKTLLDWLNAGAHEIAIELSPLDLTDIRLRSELLLLTMLRMFWPELFDN